MASYRAIPVTGGHIVVLACLYPTNVEPLAKRYAAQFKGSEFKGYLVRALAQAKSNVANITGVICILSALTRDSGYWHAKHKFYIEMACKQHVDSRCVFCVCSFYQIPHPGSGVPTKNTNPDSAKETMTNFIIIDFSRPGLDASYQVYIQWV